MGKEKSLIQNLKSLRTSQEVKNLLMSKLPYANPTPDEVVLFLKQHGLGHYDLTPKSYASDSHIAHLIKFPYDSYIEATTPAPSQREFLFFRTSLMWRLRFQFDANQLAEIIVTLYEPFPL